MKVVFIYRKSRSGVYSIEELFHTIADELGKEVEVIEYEVGARHRVFLDAWVLRKLNADIYHVTGDVNYMVNLLPSKKTVLTVHDIGHYLFGLKGIRQLLYKWLWLILPIRSSAVVIASSKNTRDNILKHLGIIDKPIVVLDACHSTLFKPTARLFNDDCPSILQVGTGKNKNVLRLIESLKGVRCQLILIGKLDEQTLKKLSECNIFYENLVGISHEKLYEQYVNCDFVAFASISEGFGVPIIEAQACGRPVITSDVSPMKEVAGEGACLVDPLNVLQIRNSILKIINDACYRDRLRASGTLNVMRYSPTTISEQYFDLYKNITLTSSVTRVGETD